MSGTAAVADSAALARLSARCVPLSAPDAAAAVAVAGAPRTGTGGAAAIVAAESDGFQAQAVLGGKSGLRGDGVCRRKARPAEQQ